MKYKRQKRNSSKYSSNNNGSTENKCRSGTRSRAVAAGIVIITLFSLTRIGFLEKNLVRRFLESSYSESKTGEYINTEKAENFLDKLGQFTAEFCFGYLRNNEKGNKAYATNGEEITAEEISEKAKPDVIAESDSETKSDASEEVVAKRGFEAIIPCSGGVSSPFGKRVHPVTGVTANHNGVDIACASGTKVSAVSDGMVETAQYNEYSGNFVVIRHQNGFTSSYAHLSKISVSPGQSVSAGEEIGKSGSTGMVTGPHLHFEIRQNGVALNPFDYISGD